MDHEHAERERGLRRFGKERTSASADPEFTERLPVVGKRTLVEQVYGGMWGAASSAAPVQAAAASGRSSASSLLPPPSSIQDLFGRHDAPHSGAVQRKVDVERTAGAGPRADATAGPAGDASGLPALLRSGLEEMSGFDLGGVRVHRGSSEPSRLNARAFARGTEIHLGPGNDGDLPHEAWHIVQQMQDRVATTTQHAGNAINDDPGLEREADEMGARAARGATGDRANRLAAPTPVSSTPQLRGVTLDLVQQAIGLQKNVQLKRAPEGAAPVAQRVVYDENDNEDVNDADDVYDLIHDRFMTLDKQGVLDRIQALINKPTTRYSTSEVVDDLIERGVAQAVPDDRNLQDHSGRKRIGGKIYTPGPRGFQRDGDVRDWRVKDSPIQRGYAETEFLGALLYAAIIGQHGATELHYHGTNPYGVVVKQDLPGFRNWANAMDDFSHGAYDAQGLGRIAVAAWFLGEHDMHTANFGPTDHSNAPQLAVADPSGALHDENLARPLTHEDFERLPLPPEDWTHAEGGGWQMHDRSCWAQPNDPQTNLSQPVEQRLQQEKLEAVARIAQLDLGTIEAQVLSSAFLDSIPLANLLQPDTVDVWGQWTTLRPTLEARRQQVVQVITEIMLENLGRRVDQHIQNRPPPRPLTMEEETRKFWK